MLNFIHQNITKYIDYIIFLLFLLGFSLTGGFHSLPHQVNAAQKIQSGSKVNIKARLDFTNLVRIYGYTSPNTSVRAESVRVFGKTVSDNNGFFVIDNLAISKQAKEICLEATDDQNRSSYPLCLPAPQTIVKKNIGPVVLPPTLSLSTNLFYVGQQAFASGKSLPGKKLEIVLFEVKDINQENKKGLSFIPKVYAMSLPKLEVVTDNSGKFNFTLPTTRSTAFRLFATGALDGNPIPKSQTIFFYINPLSYILFKNFLPVLLWLVFFVVTGVFLWYYNRKTGRVSDFLEDLKDLIYYLFTGMKLKQLAVKIRLQRKRLWYNLLEFVKKGQK